MKWWKCEMDLKDGEYWNGKLGSHVIDIAYPLHPTTFPYPEIS